MPAASAQLLRARHPAHVLPAACRLPRTVLITLMLALVALQWVIAADLPDSSYLLPTSQLILLAYVSLGLLVMISVAVYRIR